jgi:cytochrome c-type biogenesis protein CcmH
MTTFWSLAAVLLLLSLLFVIPPLWRRRAGGGVERVALNIQVIKDQLAELDVDLAAGKLGQSDYAAARADLERELLDNTTAAESHGDSDSGGRWIGLVLAIAIPVAALLIYQQIGTSQIIPRLAAGPATAPAEKRVDGQTMESVVAKLAERMQEHPDNVEGWLLLGRSYASMSRFTEAVNAYERAAALAGEDAGVLSDYANVLIMASGGQFTPRAGELLDRAVAADPAHVKARWLRGHWRFRRSDYRGAIDDWQTLVQALPPGDEKVATIMQQIDAARIRLDGSAGELATTSKPTAPAASADAASAVAAIKVQVSLDPALKDKAADDDTVFIFARAAQGPRMPLAIVRKRVVDLPVSVTLDDSLAMSPAMVLSKFKQVVVGARISKSGQASAASGDLQGLVSPVDTRGGEVSLLIDSVVP